MPENHDGAIKLRTLVWYDVSYTYTIDIYVNQEGKTFYIHHKHGPKYSTLATPVLTTT